MARFPKPYVNDVPQEGKTPGIVTVDFDRMGIGARNSGMPKTPPAGPGSLQHVGGSAGSGGSK